MVNDSDLTFQLYRFTGTHHQIGRQYGEATVDLVRRHRDLALARLGQRAGIRADRALAAALQYRPFVQEHAAFLDEEIQGVAEGAGISLAEAYLLQLRAELAAKHHHQPVGETGDECTTFAVLAEATANGTPLIGQNADLPSFYREVGVVAEIVADDAPAVLMLLPSGQVSYIGINDRGLGVFANFLTCDGWRVGFPRYLLSRLVLTKESVEDAIAALRATPRASSRNLIMLDAHGRAADMETTPTRDVRLDPDDGLLAHTNHYVAPELQAEERSPERHVANSRVRLNRMEELLRQERRALDAAAMQTLMRDRVRFPDALCRKPGDDPTSDVITFASVIAEPSRKRMWVAVGPPSEHAYHGYALSGAAEPQSRASTPESLASRS